MNDAHSITRAALMEFEGPVCDLAVRAHVLRTLYDAGINAMPDVRSFRISLSEHETVLLALRDLINETDALRVKLYAALGEKPE